MIETPLKSDYLMTSSKDFSNFRLVLLLARIKVSFLTGTQGIRMMLRISSCKRLKTINHLLKESQLQILILDTNSILKFYPSIQ